MKRDTYCNGASKQPRYTRTPQIEAALHLVSVAKRFAADKANAADVDAAIEIWRESRAEAPHESR